MQIIFDENQLKTANVNIY